MKKLTLLSLVLAGTGFVLAEVETWTSREGKSEDMELVSAEEKNGKIIGTFRMKSGKTVQISESNLDASGAERLQAKLKEATAAVTKGASVYDDLAEDFVKLEGKKVEKFELTNQPDYFAFYFSAHWCRPCRAFTPELVKFYKKNQKNDGGFEVIFVSSDRDKKSMEGYMEEAEMPWPAIAFDKVSRAGQVKKLRGKGIPCLVLVDREGKVIKHSYENGQYIGPYAVLAELEKLLKSDQG